MFKLFERYGEKILYVKIIYDKIIEENDQVKLFLEKIVFNEVMRYIVIIFVQKIEEGDDFDIYDDFGEFGEDLDDVEQ